MRHTLPLAPQFYVTAPQPCPYLAGRLERKLFTSLQGDTAELLNDALSKQGFRRSQNVLYRPACADCSACLSARIRVADFAPSRSQRRVMNRNASLSRTANAPWATEAQFELFRRYLDARHSDGGMADMDIFEFAAMIEETPIKSRVVEYKSNEPTEFERTSLKAVALTDVLDDGVSMVYSFYDTSETKLSLGTFLILDHIEIARAAGLPFVYLGYWVAGSEKMAYKANFSGLEVYRHGEWQPLDRDDTSEDLSHPLSVQPIAEQVSEISLPDTRPTR